MSEEIKLSDSILEAMQNADKIAVEMISPEVDHDAPYATSGAKSDDEEAKGASSAYSMTASSAHGMGKLDSAIAVNKKGKRYCHTAVYDEEEGLYFASSDKKTKHIMFFELKVKRISAINTTEETFRCAFHYYLTWLATKEDWNLWQNLKKEKKHKDYVPGSFVPKVSFVNVVDIHDRDSKLKYYVKNAVQDIESMGPDEWAMNTHALKIYGMLPWKGIWNRCKYSFEATFAEQFELDSFPFDSQDLSIVLKCDTPLNQSDILPFPRDQSDFISFDSSFSATGEWTYEGLMCEFSKTDRVHSKAGKEYSRVNISVKSKRNWRAHQSSFVISACMFAAGLSTFAIDHEGEGLANRLDFGITLLLADVAVLQFIFGNVPNIPYFTLFDKYVHYCFRFLFSIIVWCAILGLIERICNDWNDIVGTCDSDVISWIDYAMFLVFILVYVACHWYLWQKCKRAMFRENHKKDKTTRELEELFDHSKNLVISEKKVMYVNCSDWERNHYIVNETEEALKRNLLREYFTDDIVEFAKIRQTIAQASRDKNRPKK